MEPALGRFLEQGEIGSVMDSGVVGMILGGDKNA